jgi:hypothetical protein
MDITVRRTGEEAWSLEDLLGRPMGVHRGGSA